MNTRYYWRRQESTRVTNFRKDWYEQLTYRLSALLTSTEIWFSDDAVDIHGRHVAGCRVLRSHNRDLSNFWRIRRLLYPRCLRWWRQRHRGWGRRLIKALCRVFVHVVLIAWVTLVALVLYSFIEGYPEPRLP